MDIFNKDKLPETMKALHHRCDDIIDELNKTDNPLIDAKLYDELGTIGGIIRTVSDIHGKHIVVTWIHGTELTQAERVLADKTPVEDRVSTLNHLRDSYRTSVSKDVKDRQAIISHHTNLCAYWDMPHMVITDLGG